jgi:TetR/AcrR family transcriptional repressor of nem operon
VAATAGARRHTEQGLERKEQLLEQATRLFASRGYANTRVIDICKAAGVAKGLFYWYFDNKEALFAELVRSMREQLAATRAEAMDPDADPLTQLRQAVESSVRFIAHHTEFFTVLRMERREPTVSAMLREASDADVAGVARLVAAAQASGQLTATDPPELLALGVAGAVTSFCHAHRTGRLGIDEHELAEVVARWVVRAVGGDPCDPDRAQGDDAQAVRVLPSGTRQRVRVAHTSQPTAPAGISAK